MFSGDARNSGALDVNIRGIQGPGRVPVSIDGGEQALTVWRGYNGVSNRNYIDPNLIGGIQVIKGPGLVRDVHSGIGGALVIKTIDVDDVVAAGERFGGELKIEGGSNAVAPRLPRLHTGEDYRTVPGFPQGSPNSPYDDRTLVVPVKSRSGNNPFDGEDQAWRLALGVRGDNVDLMAAYAWRKRGNYFSGTQGSAYYEQDQREQFEYQGIDYITTLARYFKPGDEVPNTSSEQESWLVKGSWQINDDQQLKATWRRTLSHYGEIMPSRILSAPTTAASSGRSAGSIRMRGTWNTVSSPPAVVGWTCTPTCGARKRKAIPTALAASRTSQWVIRHGIRTPARSCAIPRWPTRAMTAPA